MTVLGYFRDALKSEGRDCKYLNDDFIHKFTRAHDTGDYSEVHATDFYNKNGSAYCRFLELWERVEIKHIPLREVR